MPADYPMAEILNATSVRVTVRVPRPAEGAPGDCLTVATLIFKPGYMSLESVKPPAPITYPPRYMPR